MIYKRSVREENSPPGLVLLFLRSCPQTQSVRRTEAKSFTSETAACARRTGWVVFVVFVFQRFLTVNRKCGKRDIFSL